MAKEKLKTGRQDALDVLVENSVSLQKVLTDLALSMNKLTREISQMMDLFKETAKDLSERKEIGAGIEGEELKKKIDSLTDQNKTIARGILLIEDYLKEKGEGTSAKFMESKKGLPPSPEY